MDFIRSPQPTCSSSSSSSSSSSFSSYLKLDSSRREISKKILQACQMIIKFISAIIMLILALGGSVIGSVSGAITGVTTETGLFRGAVVGAISGAVFIIEAFEPSDFAISDSYEPGIFNILDAIDLVYSLLSGRLVHEKVGLAVQTAIENEIAAMEFPFVEGVDVHEICGARGMLRDAIEKLPSLIISSNDCRNSSGESITCTICIQDFRVGEKAIKLHHCRHVFHTQCIRGWLLKHGSCPLCRQSY